VLLILKGFVSKIGCQIGFIFALQFFMLISDGLGGVPGINVAPGIPYLEVGKWKENQIKNQ
jgi:hypothetical protein